MELRLHCLEVFRLTDPVQKAAAVLALAPPPACLLDCTASLTHDGPPGRPPRPELVQPQDVPRRSPFTLEGHCALVHAIAHIEFNAINLALDAVWRFADMPAPYYLDWLRVAQEEAKHFTLLHNHLRTLGHDYGDFMAHDGLWNLCEATRHDVVARMALVPRTLEARGLDATPIIQAKLRKVGTPHALAAVAILDIILEEEVGHVAIGNHWYHWLCQRDQLDPLAFYRQVAEQHGAPRPKPPFNLSARRLAGFSDAELAALPTVTSA
ncbi:ferritin-like domain-containing protein [Candidatus Aalborgicola defluviihabitans]|uniref:ferritin-like domain-containing protein n=1 Tax=Candidatus Aalborgicola defluviihabitans TaxID=3386187 RepID=UPI001EBEB8A8|nr:ferritin-like domain-containing protein [Burkholderiales bacterium]